MVCRVAAGFRFLNLSPAVASPARSLPRSRTTRYRDSAMNITSNTLIAERRWPSSTVDISELRLVIGYQRQNGSDQTLTLDIVDYPGEWLLDLPLLDKVYEQWSAETLGAIAATAARAARTGMARASRNAPALGPRG